MPRVNHIYGEWMEKKDVLVRVDSTFKTPHGEAVFVYKWFLLNPSDFPILASFMVSSHFPKLYVSDTKSPFPHNQYLSGCFFLNPKKQNNICSSFIDGFIARISVNNVSAKLGVG